MVYASFQLLKTNLTETIWNES